MRFLACLAGSLFAAWFTPALADDSPFLNADSTAITSKGEAGLQQWFDWGTGHTGESYQSFLSLTEFDYGFTDRLQGSLTVVYSWDRTRPPLEPAQTNSLPGLAGELIYVALPVDRYFIGAALALDSSFDAKNREIDFRVLLEKHFWGFNNVLNINFENYWEKDPTAHWTRVGNVAFHYGLGYAVDEHWSVAIEFGNEIALDDLFVSGRLHNTGKTYFLGPTLQYDCRLMVVTVGAQMQLPWAEGNNAVHGYTPDADRLHVGLRLTRAI